jgi:23S rRNA (pseudouridine1915-N3)-methyltransferase
MHIRLIAVGTRVPDWIVSGYQDYASRLPREWRLQLYEVAPVKRAKSMDSARLLRDEGQRILTLIPDTALAVALVADGRQWSTGQLAEQLQNWLLQGRDLVFVIGGADGLDQRVLQRCETHWSLSALIFPHALVRILIAEQLYRAWSILNNHPYHRA